MIECWKAVVCCPLKAHTQVAIQQPLYSLRKLQLTPWTYPRPSTTCLWRKSCSYIFVFWGTWGMFQGSVGIFLDTDEVDEIVARTSQALDLLLLRPWFQSRTRPCRWGWTWSWWCTKKMNKTDRHCGTARSWERGFGVNFMVASNEFDHTKWSLSSGPVDMEIHPLQERPMEMLTKKGFWLKLVGFFLWINDIQKMVQWCRWKQLSKSWVWCARECLGNPFAMGLIRGFTIRDSEIWVNSLSINPCAIRLFVLDYFVGKMHPACNPWSIWTGAGEAFPTFWRTEYEGQGGAPWEHHGNFIETSDSLMLMR